MCYFHNYLCQVTSGRWWSFSVHGPHPWRYGNAYEDLTSSPHIPGLISEADLSGKVIYSTCAGPRVLAAAGAIYLGPDTLPVIDSNIVTSTRGM